MEPETYQAFRTEADFRLLPETQQFLSRRTQHALLRAGFETAEQLMLASSAELMNIRNFGRTSLAEMSNWREALMAYDPAIYKETLDVVIKAMDATESVLTERRAAAAMSALWALISRSPFTAARIRQMLTPPTPDD